jgi:two-component sensor histidine kinase
VTESDHESIEITITNDGQPLPQSPEPGTGTAIIEAWVSRYDGNWTLSSESGATVLRALLYPGSPQH